MSSMEEEQAGADYVVDLLAQNKQLQAELKTERGNLAWALATLAVAICPHCDGSGVVTNMCGDTPEPEQCQWCHDRARLQALKEKQDG